MLVKLDNIQRGYSKENRPDLKQAVLSLMTTHQSAIPTWIEPLSGNSSDKETLARTVRAYQRQMRAEKKASYYVVDSALYSKGNIRDLDDVWWISRVPLTIKKAQALLVEETAEEMPAFDQEGYRGREYEVSYGQVKQRWLVIYSAQAAERQAKTFNRHRNKARQQAQQKLKALQQQQFACAADARLAVKELNKKLKYHQIQAEIAPVMGYDSPGRPSKGSQPQVQGYQVQAELEPDGQCRHTMRENGVNLLWPPTSRTPSVWPRPRCCLFTKPRE